MDKISGSCNCGAVTYEISNNIKRVVNCHCSMCRKMNGSSFSTYVVVPDTSFTLISGEANLSGHAVSQNATKSFCNICGTPIYNLNPKYQGLKILHLGSLDNAQLYRPEANIFCDTKLDWLDGISTITSFEQAMK
jgi:hypothetical protein